MFDGFLLGFHGLVDGLGLILQGFGPALFVHGDPFNSAVRDSVDYICCGYFVDGVSLLDDMFAVGNNVDNGYAGGEVDFFDLLAFIDWLRLCPS